MTTTVTDTATDTATDSLFADPTASLLDTATRTQQRTRLRTQQRTRPPRRPRLPGLPLPGSDEGEERDREVFVDEAVVEFEVPEPDGLGLDDLDDLGI